MPNGAQVVRWINGQGSLSSESLTTLAQREHRLFVVVATDSERARNIGDEIQFFDPDLPVQIFPDTETLPYDHFSPQADIVAQRLTVLADLPTRNSGVLVVPIRTLMQRIPPKDYVLSRTFNLNVGERLDLEAYRRHLAECGYRRVDTVYEHGEYASRGSVLDLYPVGSARPIRIDLFDDIIESLRLFDSETQRTIERTEFVRILPAHEYPLDESAVIRFRSAWNAHFESTQWNSPVYRDISEAKPVEGVECYLPLFFESTSSLLDYVNDQAVFFLDSEINLSINGFLSEVEERFEQYKHDPERPLLPPSAICFRENELRQRWNRFPRIQVHEGPDTPKHSTSLHGLELPPVALEPRRNDPLRRLRNFLGNVQSRVLITAESQGRLRHLLEILGRAHMNPTEVATYNDFRNSSSDLAIAISPITRGFWTDEHAVLTETQILGPRPITELQRARRRTVDPESVIRNLTELHPGVPVVHVDHGVGRYLGLETLSLRSEVTEFVALEYADGDKLYVPVSSLDLISRYSGADDEHAPLHKLGSDAWAKAKSRAAKRIFDVAAELLSIYARRAASQSVVFASTDDDYQDFCDHCEFELTVDQEVAIEAVLKDLTKPIATDRLICGDVGFGKTEVAMRAAFHVVQSNWQVLLLCPTTILAQQHFETFSDRFAKWPMLIELLSRFRTASETESIVERVSNGKVDILIGTHKLLSAKMDLSKVGLLIVDEEHRFGVRDKERIRNLRAEVHTISLTATPIPRTLNMSMGELRDLSIIATPPAKRLAVKTFVVPYNRAVVREAIQREIARGGQVFYLHNDVRSMPSVYDGLKELVPDAHIEVGHGQMPKNELERVMSDFYHRRCNLLLCSTIIESGLDIPNANTIIIERADSFGLAQLHQLRGRVGRAARQAYAYLLTPDEGAMTVDAKKRLDAIESAGELGSGFTLAVHDLEIRGAGELLGREQSGQLETIGFSLYMQMLDRAIKTLKSGIVPNFDDPMPTEHEVSLSVSALIPETYLPDIHGRLVTYKQIAAASSESELTELKIELIDRCGPLPDLVEHLFRITSIKLRAKQVGLSKIILNEDGGRIEFREDRKFSTESLVTLLQDHPDSFQMTPEQHVRVLNAPADAEDRFRFIDKFIDDLEGSKSDALAA